MIWMKIKDKIETIVVKDKIKKKRVMGLDVERGNKRELGNPRDFYFMFL